MSDLHDRRMRDDPAIAALAGLPISGPPVDHSIPPLLADICTAAANSADAQASIAEYPERYVVAFARAGSDAIATLVVQKQLFADAIDWGERRIRAELEHEAAKVCATLKGDP